VRKALVVLLVTLVAATAWAQVADPMLGPHNTNNTFGCQSCHAPHSATLGGNGLYLWGLNTPTTTYTTYGSGSGVVGGVPTSGSITGNLTTLTMPDTRVHSILCLSCHDGTFNATMSLTAGSTGGPSVYSISTAINVGSSGALKAGHSEITTVSGNVVGSGGTDLTSNHPVNVLYPNGSASATGIYTNQEIVKFWKATPAATPCSQSVVPGCVTFVDTSVGAYTYGHAVQLYTANGTDAYVECSSCHDPHAWQQTAVPLFKSSKMTQVPVTTAHFLRGQYVSAQDIDGFCMSCHADKSAVWNGTGNQ